MASDPAIAAHYAGPPGLSSALVAALGQSGADLADLRAEDLAALDEFHVRGRDASRELAAASALAPGMTVLDAGSGLGGPARALAREWGCRVTGIDLSGAYCAVAAMLNGWLGLAERVSQVQGDVLALPFAAASFDRVWTQHTAMNLADKPAFYRELARVLKPGGRLALYDVLQGPAGAPHFPLPWARSPATSFLASAAELRTHLTDADFIVERWDDSSEAGRRAFAKTVARVDQRGLPPLGLHLLLGKDFPLMLRNQLRNLEEGRIQLVQVIARPAG